jgi:3-hydroxy-3-methylglutaryl CoA synthase
MASILRYGAYLPRPRISVKEIHGFYGKPGRPRARTLATPGLDEDSLTMAFEAAAEALGPKGSATTLIAVTQSPPFGMRKMSSTLAQALGLSATPYDVGGHPGALLDAFSLGATIVDSGGGDVLVVASDYVVSYDERVADLLPAGAGAAFLLSSEGCCELGESARASDEIYDVWRLGLEPEPRYRLEVLAGAYGAAAKGALGALEAKTGTATSAYKAVCPSQPHPSVLRSLGRMVGKGALDATSFVAEIGNTGSASVGISLALGLDSVARKGQKLLALGYGAGEGIAQALEITNKPRAIGLADRLAGTEISMGTFYRWTRGRQAEPH